MRAPLAAANAAENMNITVNVSGGGYTGQAGALAQGLGRALTMFDPTLRAGQKEGGFLTRDSRMKERKKYGQRVLAVASSSRSGKRNVTYSVYLQRRSEWDAVVVFIEGFTGDDISAAQQCEAGTRIWCVARFASHRVKGDWAVTQCLCILGSLDRFSEQWKP